MIIKSARLQQGPTSAVAVSDTAIAIGTYDNKVLLFDRSSHRRLSAASHDHLVNSCDFHPDGTLLATASSDRTARLWTTTGLKLVMVLSDHDDDVMLVRFSPSGASIATCSYDGTILITAVPDGKRIANCVGHEDGSRR